MRLRYFYRPHRWREVAPRRHPVPDLVQIVLQIGFEVLDGTPVHPRCTLIVLDLLPRLLTDTLNEEDRDGLGEWDGVMVRLDRGHGGVVVVIVSRRPVACSCVGVTGRLWASCRRIRACRGRDRRLWISRPGRR